VRNNVETHDKRQTHSHPQSGGGEDAACLEGLHDGDVSFHAHRHHDEHRGHVAEGLDVQVHLAHEQSQGPTATHKSRMHVPPIIQLSSSLSLCFLCEAVHFQRRIFSQICSH